MQTVQNVAFGKKKKIPKSPHFWGKKIGIVATEKKIHCKKGFLKKDLFLENLDQTRHILRKEILKPPYLDTVGS